MLLVRTRRGAWTLSGGKVEPNEALPRAAAREAQEEAGVEGTIHAEPIAWVRLRKCPGDFLHTDATMTPVFLLEVRALVEPYEGFRDPRWWPFDETERALRHRRAPWSARWLVPAVRAAAAALEGLGRPAGP